MLKTCATINDACPAVQLNRLLLLAMLTPMSNELHP